MPEASSWAWLEPEGPAFPRGGASAAGFRRSRKLHARGGRCSRIRASAAAVAQLRAAFEVWV